MKVAVITFHRVYNYGAVIQAYALMKAISSYGHDVEVLDFSKEKQRDYTNIISKKNGFKRFIKTLLLFPVYKERKERRDKFDRFINHSLNVSDKTLENETALLSVADNYDSFVCGSDQIWNPLKDSDFTTAYMLDFTSKLKIAYAPSIGNADEKDLLPYKELLKAFTALSCREAGGAKKISGVVGRDCDVVLDPTLLVDKEDLTSLTRKLSYKPYILYYSLDGHENKDRNMNILKELSERFNLECKIITPEWPFHKEVGEDVRNAGIEDFLSLIRNASLVCTNSFHGTALSIKLERPFYVLEEKNIKDERKRSLLIQLGLQDRIISDAKGINIYDLDYRLVNDSLEKLRMNSKEYLTGALEGSV